MRRTGLARGTALALGASASNQIGAGLGALAFPAIGPLGVVAVRQLVAVAVLTPLGRPRLRGISWADRRLILALGLIFSVMNATLYLAIERIGLGLAITLEFLGPLVLAVVASRRLLDLLCGLLAAVGVVVLVAPGPSTDLLGIALGLVAAASWASYVLLNRSLGRRLPGVRGAAGASVVSAVIWIPFGAAWFIAHPPPLWALALAAACGLLASALPFAVDMIALRSLPTGLFSTLQSMHPVWAAVAGLVILQQVLTPREWLGIGLIVLSNAAVTSAGLLRRQG
ncbi:EamA family transporter [Leucobacter weissii]|uniref:EamA family transporter n=1 Tax=Leucobacter weissii TaxID=1983706 RepID=A0A939MIC7_9MICO|nr:EamA family transporter [Leucobacter weissii]